LIEWVEILSLSIFLIGFYYMVIAYLKEEKLNILLAYSAIMVGIFYDVWSNFLPETDLTFYYYVFLEHYIGIMGAGILFALSAYFAYRRMKTIEGE